MSLDDRHNEVADLSYHRNKNTAYREEYEVGVTVEEYIRNKSESHKRECAENYSAYASLDGLFGAYVLDKLMLAEEHAREIREDICHPRADEYEQIKKCSVLVEIADEKYHIQRENDINARKCRRSDLVVCKLTVRPDNECKEIYEINEREDGCRSDDLAAGDFKSLKYRKQKCDQIRGYCYRELLVKSHTLEHLEKADDRHDSYRYRKYPSVREEKDRHKNADCDE